MNRFIAYFDYLGFKDFIENNDFDFQKQIVFNNLRDIEDALGQGSHVPSPRGVVADLSQTIVNCLNFSDTVVFWTNDDSEESMLEILKVAYRYNSRTNYLMFPVRGALAFGEMEYIGANTANEKGGTYNVNSVFGRGLVSAYLKAESQHWAGSVIDSSFIDAIEAKRLDVDEVLQPFAKRYQVPYKDKILREDEYVLNLIKGELNDEALKNFSKSYRENFGQYNKSSEHPSVQEKIENTLSFLRTYHKPSGKS